MPLRHGTRRYTAVGAGKAAPTVGSNKPTVFANGRRAPRDLGPAGCQSHNGQPNILRSERRMSNAM